MAWNEVGNIAGKTNIKKLKAFGGYLYAIAGGPEIHRSSDGGATWTLIDLSSLLGATGASRCFGEFGSYLYVGGVKSSKGIILRSLDGLNWSVAKEYTVYNKISTTFIESGGYLYVGMENYCYIERASDGISFAEVNSTATSGDSVEQLCLFDEDIYAAVDTGEIYTTSDGETWSVAYDTAQSGVYSLAVFDSKIYAGTGTGGRIYSSADGSSWALAVDLPSGFFDVLTMAAWKGGLFATTDITARTYSTTDGTTWSEYDDLTETDINSIEIFNDLLYIGTSPNGLIFEADPPVTGDLIATLPAITAEIIEGPALSATLPAITAELLGGGLIGATLPAIACGIEGTNNPGALGLGNKLIASLPAMTIAEGDLSGNTTAAALVVILPAITAEIQGGHGGFLEATLPAITADIKSGAILEVTLPAITASLEGDVQISGDLIVSLPAITANLEGKVNVHGDLVCILPAIIAELTGTVEVGASLVCTLPMITAELNGYQDISGELIATLPAITAYLIGATDRFADCDVLRYSEPTL